MMKTLFDTNDRDAILQRIERLTPDTPREWGRMNVAQMLTHCAIALEQATGVHPMKQIFLGRILSPFVRRSILGEKPIRKSSPTHPDFVITDERDFSTEQARLTGAVNSFAERGADEASKATHTFFGRLSGKEWGELMYKHIDHHLQQFGS